MLDPRDWQDPAWKLAGQDHGEMKGPLHLLSGFYTLNLIQCNRQKLI